MNNSPLLENDAVYTVCKDFVKTLLNGHFGCDHKILSPVLMMATSLPTFKVFFFCFGVGVFKHSVCLVKDFVSLKHRGFTALVLMQP